MTSALISMTSPATGARMSAVALIELENGGAVARLKVRADLGQFDKDEIADLSGGMTGDADDGDIAIELEPFVGAGEFQHDIRSNKRASRRQPLGQAAARAIREHTQCQSCGGKIALDSTVKSGLR